tara:strand:- start:666 stop:902 length:237 start_codon:yes stop_codon:yes gene_type:complete
MTTYEAIMILDGAIGADIEEMAEAVVFAINENIPMSTGTMSRNLGDICFTGIISGTTKPVSINQDMLIEYLEYLELGR